MPLKINVIDLYFDKAADFAKPILVYLRDMIDVACPEAGEKMKWSFPHFDYQEEMMCQMAGLKYHGSFGFWKATLMKDNNNLFNTENAIGHFGKLTPLKDLPSDKIMLSYIKKAMKLNDDKVKMPACVKSTVANKIVAPDYFTVELKKNESAKKHFQAFSPSQKREYIDWLKDAKTEMTRDKRMQQALELIAERKIRNRIFTKIN